MITKIAATGIEPEVESIEEPPERLEGPELLLEHLRQNPDKITTFEFQDSCLTTMDLVDEIIELREYNARAFAMISRMGEAYGYEAEVDSTGVNVNVRSRLTIALAETFGSYLRHPDAKNYVTMELTSPDPAVGRFEVTIRRLDGETPAEQLVKLKQDRAKLIAILEANGISSRGL
jgi:hypothetical protein